MCDVVHVLLMERVEREALAVRVGLIARGAEEMPTVEDAQAQFNDALAAPPERSSNDLMHERLMKAAG
ncbi:MAG: hypothetical protein NVSMB4_05050 [Acidimicrobiales bacterium]